MKVYKVIDKGEDDIVFWSIRVEGKEKVLDEDELTQKFLDRIDVSDTDKDYILFELSESLEETEKQLIEQIRT